jgi:hypothetical protein
VNEQITFATRAEELKDRVYEFFTMPPKAFYSALLKNKAAVLVGGRGTGKTMLLKSLAFEYKVASKTCEQIKEQWDTDHYIGCYIKIENYIVSTFRERGLTDDTWNALLAHYFNLRILQQILKTLKILINNKIIQEENINDFIERFYEMVKEEISIKTLKNLEMSVRRKLDDLINFINNPGESKKPTLTHNGLLIFELCDVLNENSAFKDKTWYVLLDEFENLSATQQPLINTLIKANKPPVIFKIAMRPDGWWSRRTITESETLEEIDDYDLINYQSDLSHLDYKDLIIKAFEKNLSFNNIKDQVFLDVRKFLPELTPEDEALLILKKSKKKSNYEKKILEYINKSTTNVEEVDYLSQHLIVEKNPLQTRLHLVLLDRGENPTEIVHEYITKSKKYTEWYDHNHLGTLFLFCKEFEKKKVYSGFETYLYLSSKIMRNFVSLFSRAWELSLDEGFKIETPTPFSTKVQSKAAYDVSQKKVFEISSYPSIGSGLSTFANQLGRIFEQLNKDERQSQPERNHFSIIGDLSEEARSLVSGALLYSVLQEASATKIRSDVQIRDRDYLINRIYCPYYQLSYRKKHKLEISTNDFELLILGSDVQKKKISSGILKKCLPDSNVNFNFEQIDIFDALF